eukprot:PhM_4_TR18710/c0_g1_i1/m.62219
MSTADTPTSSPTAQQLIDRMVAIECENHKLHLQVLVLREALMKSINGTLSQADRTMLESSFLAASDFKMTSAVNNSSEAAMSMSHCVSVDDGICDVCFSKGHVRMCALCRRACYCSVKCEVDALAQHFSMCKMWRENYREGVLSAQEGEIKEGGED